MTRTQIRNIIIKGARVHNLKNINVDVPLHGIVGIAGVSGSGKSSLALGVLYAEGSRRYLESLSTYTRRRMTQAPKADVEEALYVPAALALRQRPGVPGIRSTFGTSTELLNSLRLMYSRLASHRCPNGHYLEPTMAVAAEQPIFCHECGERVYPPSAEELAFNSLGACPVCSGTGVAMTVNKDSLVPDESLSIAEGAVAPWRSLMWSLMTDVCKAMGVRIDVPFRDLTPEEKEIVYNGPAEKKHILYRPKKGDSAHELEFTYYSAIRTVENALSKVKDENGMKRVEKFLKQTICPACHGSRLSEKARAPHVRGIGLDKACEMSLAKINQWVAGIPETLPSEMRPMARSICQAFHDVAKRLLELGLDYLALERASATLSTGERQRVQLARAVRNRTTGVLYVLDEPSIGLHPHNAIGLIGIMKDLTEDGNSIVLVDHDVLILKEADWIIEMGPGAGSKGGQVLGAGTVEETMHNPDSLIGPFLSGKATLKIRETCPSGEIFKYGCLHLETRPLHTVKSLQVDIPKSRMTVVTGVSGSGKTTLILESLVPGLEAILAQKKLPPHIVACSAEDIEKVKLIDATPIGINVRSTVATYAEIHDELRKLYAHTPKAREMKLKAGDFSYNTGKLRCPLCDGTGQISLDVQFLPDVDITCPECGGSRYAHVADDIKLQNKKGKSMSLPALMRLDVDDAMYFCAKKSSISQKLEILANLGLGYLTLGEATPELSGGEAQRLKLASEMGKIQANTVFIFDEPTIGLHPLDVATLLRVFQKLLDLEATIIVIEHDRDVILNADYVIDMGPGGGDAGGQIVAAGAPGQIRANAASITGKYLNSR